ncbi:hypothetical protein Acsp03_69420 [Actinomadura sp. NBRC 104412]|uniref:hypothetical protein n=1 Tax=Actinomadura sp. NBRC 104412 TaxID=3032203 RepID=UPI0024A608AD|nr:hypothetical protein [Actinomadura sp. NBRC 104412]GLZ09476.1 hypothetical protein Acsp03_69420 [Actinomadura sp. NBRC 104412]
MAAAWYGPDGRAVTAADAGRLLADWRGRIVAENLIPSGQVVLLVVTSFTVAPVHGAPPPGLPYAGGEIPSRPEPAPILWETMVTVEDTGALVGRYRSRVEAEAGHARIVAQVYQLLESFPPGQVVHVLARVPPR